MTDESVVQGCGKNVGECKRGLKVCTNGVFGPCRGQIRPTNEECDGLDNDCDSQIDEQVTRQCGTDVGTCQVGTETCSNGEYGGCIGSIEAAAEICDAADNDCDGRIDEGVTQVCGSDVGACEQGIQTCSNGEFSLCTNEVTPTLEICDDIDNDCDGQVDNITETCDGQDNDCDGITDEGVMTTYYRDDDGDGYGDSDSSVEACDPPAGFVAMGGDCDSTQNRINPGRPELCDAIDNDCDTTIDEETNQPCGTDEGVCEAGVQICLNGQYQACDGELGPEVLTELNCDGRDDDCDGKIDEGYVTTAAECTEGCGQLRVECIEGEEVRTCSPVASNPNCNQGGNQGGEQGGHQDGHVDCDSCEASGTNCPDGDVADLCDAVDNDCDGSIDEDFQAQGIECGVGACASIGDVRCENGQEINTCIAAEPNEAEDDSVCNGDDDDCDGNVDEGFQTTMEVRPECGTANNLSRTICLNGQQVAECIAD